MAKNSTQNTSETSTSVFDQISLEKQQHSAQLKAKIQHSIEQNHGKISFSEYMQQALYTPSLGYYNAGLKKFGAQGDFITAPEISPLFSQCLAKQCIHLMQQLNQSTLLEIGAGSGIMAIELMTQLDHEGHLAEHYFILELSAELRDRQQKAIQARLPHLYSRFQWLDRLPEKPFSGIIIANELLDAMPVHLIKIKDNTYYERFVSMDGDQFIWQDMITENPRLIHTAEHIQKVQSQQSHIMKSHADDYITEVNLLAFDWVKSIADILSSGALLLIDYGYGDTEYYHPQRSMGTLMCHYQHQHHDDPFILPGLQDITAHVNFSSIARAARTSGLHVCGFTQQAHFLMAGGLVELTQDLDPNDVLHFSEVARQIKMLTLPDEMGELFKVILLAKNKALSLPAFQSYDFSARL